MARSGDDYLETRKRQIERKKRIWTTVSIISFFGSLAFGAVSTIQRAIQNPPQVTPTQSAEPSLQEQAKGYELVLQREPNNQVALEKLSLIRVQLKDFKGAREILEKLVKQHPDRQDYQVILADIKKREK
ncbi:tetratricopeptide repeat protein [Aliinostoc sp. HNIBRCY26]|uniref:tetratricopeptide repeat protein n=1 Tax=Aliinostoc sp. HNIBRCY26 TaxID=3418997 RepID=UPI003D065D23